MYHVSQAMPNNVLAHTVYLLYAMCLTSSARTSSTVRAVYLFKYRTQLTPACMAWINSSPEYSVPLVLDLPVACITPIPHTPLLAVCTSVSLIVYHSESLIPLTYHERGRECLETHGPNTKVLLRYVTVDTSNLDQLLSANLFVQTSSNYTLVYHVHINYRKSLYQICDANEGDRLLQNALPLSLEISPYSLSNLLKTATRSIVHGASNESSLENLEHFASGIEDDKARNDQIPAVRLSLSKVIKINAGILSCWCKPNSQELLFANDCQEIQLLNLKTSQTNVISLPSHSWYTDTVIMEYSLKYNFFLHLNTSNQLAALQFEDLLGTSGAQLKPVVLASIELKITHILFNPQFDLVCLQSDRDLKIYAIYFMNNTPTIKYVKKIYKFEDGDYDCSWSPCGNFLVFRNKLSGIWKLISKFGSTLFDSQWVISELKSSDPEEKKLEKQSNFCKVLKFCFASNAEHIYLVNKNSTRMYFLNLLKIHQIDEDLSIFYDTLYISFPLQKNGGSFTRYPMLPVFQKVLSRYNCINGNSFVPSKLPTGKLHIRYNKLQQISLSYGPHLAVTTPVNFGNESNQPLWYTFYNHLAEEMNFVNHFWAGSYLIAINRFPKEELHLPDVTNEDSMIDELLIINMTSSVHGIGGSSFKFDSDMIVWRHVFKSRIISHEFYEPHDGEHSILNLITNDLKIILMEMSMAENLPNSSISKGVNKMKIRIRRTIHLSSIKNRLPIKLVQKFVSINEKHFLFLLNTGDFFFLRNQLPDSHLESTRGILQTNNMYDLILVKNAVENFYVSQIQFHNTSELTKYVTLVTGKYAILYPLQSLVAKVYDYEGVEFSGEKMSTEGLSPIKIPYSSFLPLQITQSSTSIDMNGLDFQCAVRNERIWIKNRIGKQMILSIFIAHDLFENDLSFEQICEKYYDFRSFHYCLELLLFQYLDELDKTRLRKVCELVNSTDSADFIYVNFLRKIEVQYWDEFFQLLQQTPKGFMERLISSRDVGLCYNYLNVYLNFKREVESVNPSDIDAEEQPVLELEDYQIIQKIIRMLLEASKWDDCFELCRYIKLLDLTGELLQQIREIV